MSEAKWIVFAEIEMPAGRKTRVWKVEAKDGGGQIGLVSWHGPWRQYCFFPFGERVFNRDCLRDLAEFCKTQTREHHLARRAANPESRVTSPGLEG